MLYKRYLLILVAAVIAVVLLWPDDEPPPEGKKAPATSDTRELGPPQHAPWQLRQPPGGPTGQPPRSPAYSAPREAQPPPAYPYTGGGADPYATPGQLPGAYEGYGVQPQYPAQQSGPYEGYGQPQYPTRQPAPYGGYGYQPQQPAPGYGTAPQPPQFPGSVAPPATPYGYAEPPSYRFRPLDEKEPSRRYQGGYPRQEYTYPGDPYPGYGPQR